MSRTDKDAPLWVRRARGELPSKFDDVFWLNGPPRWYITLRFRGPERARVRDVCRRAVAEYRASARVDVEAPVDQHRQGARWEWW